MSKNYILEDFQIFPIGIVDLFGPKGCKVTNSQNWRYEKSSAAQPTIHH